MKTFPAKKGAKPGSAAAPAKKVGAMSKDSVQPAMVFAKKGASKPESNVKY